jgi:hypothetical protein
MSLKLSLCALMMTATLTVHAETRVRTLLSTQSITQPNSDQVSPGRVAINGNSAIVIENLGGSRLARPYELAANGQWQAGAPLFTENSTGGEPDQDDVAIGSGFAAVHVGAQLRIFQRSGNLWVAAQTANPISAAHGLAISGGRILVARPGCNYDADIYQKSGTTGIWQVTGQIRGAVGDCNNHGALLDLDGDVALVLNGTGEIREYHRNSSVQWPQVGTITPPPGVDFNSAAPTLSGDVAFTSHGDYFRREGSAWTYQGRVQPLDSANTEIEDADYRGSLLLSFSTLGSNPTYYDRHPYLYQPNSAGGFDHVAVLDIDGIGTYADVSGNHAVVSSTFYNNGNVIEFFDLPAPLRAPAAIANDFETHDASGWEQTAGSQFALATTSAGTTYRQSSTVGTSTATLVSSDWADSESIEADVKPTAFDGSDRWVGVAVRYLDAGDQYYVTLRSSNKLQLKRNVGGVFVTLAETTLPVTLNHTYHVRLTINGSRLAVYVDDNYLLGADDNTLKHGRAALMTYRARADFDNVYAAPTDFFGLASMDFSVPGGDGHPFTTQGGTWTPVEQEGTPDVAFGQTSTAGNARAFIGTPTGDQVIETHAKLVSYGSSSQGAWFGLLARWVDANTQYYLSVRSTGKLEIRKELNGTVTVLKSVPFTATPGRYYDLKFAVIGNELHAYVDDVLVAGAIDNDIAKGQYGLGTYRAAATFQNFGVEQP